MLYLRRFCGHQLFEYLANGGDNLQVGFFVVTADIVGLPHVPFVDHAVQRTYVIFDIQPVANLLAIPVDGQGLARQGIENHQRNKFFGEMIGAVVVRAIGD